MAETLEVVDVFKIDGRDCLVITCAAPGRGFRGQLLESNRGVRVEVVAIIFLEPYDPARGPGLCLEPIDADIRPGDTLRAT